MKSGIISIGTANPPYYRDQEELGEFAASLTTLSRAQKRILKSVYKSSGINKRYSVLSDFCKEPGEFTFFPNDSTALFPSTVKRMEIYKEHALNLALEAVNDCFSQVVDGFDKQTITHLITVSCTGMYAPGLDIELVQHLQLNNHTQRTAINFMGCYGAFNAIKVADALCKSDSKAKVLVVCVELCSIHFQKTSDLANLISNAIFSDGAAAIIIEAAPKRKLWLELDSFFCTLIPQSKQEMAWHIGDQGFDMVLSAYVPDLIKIGIKNFAEELLQKTKWTLSDINFFAIHPGGQKILEAAEESLGLTKEDNRFAYEVMREYGNMSSATILFVLKALWMSLKTTDHGKTIFSCAFGPGLTLESMLLHVNAAD